MACKWINLQFVCVSVSAICMWVPCVFSTATNQNVESLRINVIPDLAPVRNDSLTIFELLTLNQLEKYMRSFNNSPSVPNNIWRSPLFLANLLDASNWNLQIAKRKTRKAAKASRANANLYVKPPNKKLFELFEFAIQGYDREGCPVVIMPAGIWQTFRTYLGKIKSLNEATSNLTAYFLNAVETILKSMKISSCVQFTLIADMEDYHDFHNSGLKFFKSSVKLFDKIYPGVLKIALFINSTPNFLQVATPHRSQVSWDLSRKSFLYTDNRSIWSQAVLKYIDETQLPQKYGGTNYFLE